jgi:hypothetical protein
VNLQKKNGSQHESTVIRKPDAMGHGLYYSLRPFENESYDQQLRLSHVGRIEETLDGEYCLPKCRRCVHSGYSCRRYTAANMITFRTSRCARCLFDGDSCQ